MHGYFVANYSILPSFFSLNNAEIEPKKLQILTKSRFLSEMCCHIAAKWIQVTATCSHFAEIWIQVTVTCSHFSAMCIHFFKKCMHFSAFWIQVTATCIHFLELCIQVTVTCIHFSGFWIHFFEMRLHKVAIREHFSGFHTLSDWHFKRDVANYLKKTWGGGIIFTFVLK